MKKFYTMLGAALIAVSAAGINLNCLHVDRTPTSQNTRLKKVVEAISLERVAKEHKGARKGAPAKVTEVISDTPFGETKYYERAGGSFYVSNGYLYEDEQEGIMEVVFGENNEVYLKNPVNYFATDTYVKGILDGNTITVSLPQTLYVWESEGYGAELAFANVTRGEEATVEGTNDVVYDDDVTEAVFTIDGNTIKLEDSDENHILAAMWDDDKTWSGRGDYETVLTETDVTEGLVFPPMGEEYYYSGKCGSTKMLKNVKVFKSGNDIYFQGIHCGVADDDQEILPESWVKGVLEGNTVTIESGQYVGYDQGYKFYFVGSDGDEGVADIILTYDEEAEKYTFENDYYLNAKPDEVYYMYSFPAGNIISKEAPEVPTPVEVPDGLETEVYLFKSYTMSPNYDEDADIYAPTFEPFSTYVNVGFDGDDVYMQGLCVDLPETWVKGTREGNTVTFPMNQYFGTEYMSFFGYTFEFDHFFTGMTISNLSTMEHVLKDAVMTFDEENSTFTTIDYIVDNGDIGRLYYNYIYGHDEESSVITKLVEVAGTPQTPEITSYNYSSYGYGTAKCNIPAVDTDGNPMVPEKLYYKFYGEINGEVTELVFDPEYYEYLEDGMVEIPYLFTEDWDIYPKGSTVYFNQPEIADLDKLGLQSIYYGGLERAPKMAEGEGNASEIFWYTIKENTSVNGIVTGKNVVSERYYNLAGQMSKKPFNGVNIIVRTYSDGTSSTVKTVK